MREIKFRAWHKGMGMIYDGVKISLSGKMFCRGDFFNLGVRNANDFTIIQYTGAKDRNGTDIYEGDILFIEECAGFDDEMIGVVKFDSEFNYCWVVETADDEVEFGNLQFRHTNIEGNVYDNPELLEV